MLPFALPTQIIEAQIEEATGRWPMGKFAPEHRLTCFGALASEVEMFCLARRRYSWTHFTPDALPAEPHCFG